MDPRKLLDRAEDSKRKSHHLCLDLRLRSLNEARKFLREHSVVLWNERGDVPNLLDATIGRIANGRERARGKAAENCDRLRKQLLLDPEFLDCRFFRKKQTALHETLWAYATVASRLNGDSLRHSVRMSREARKLLGVLEKEGPVSITCLKELLKVSNSAEARAFYYARLELMNHLLVVEVSDDLKNHPPVQLQLWEHRMPRPVRSRADQLSPRDAGLQLIAATINSSVVSQEKNVSSWFPWLEEQAKAVIDSLIEKKQVVRVVHRKISYLISRNAI